MAVSNFQVLLASPGPYRPGDVIRGEVTLTVWSELRVSAVELVLTGAGVMQVFSDSLTFVAPPRRESYLSERVAIIQPTGGAPAVALAPGRYQSAFRVVLPAQLPPSVPRADVGRGCLLDIAYAAVANIVVGGRVAKTTRRAFTVLPAAAAPAEPVSHCEQLQPLCGAGSGASTVLTRLSRAVYAVGEHVRICIDVMTERRHHGVTAVSAKLQQRVAFGGDTMRDYRRPLTAATDEKHGPRGRHMRSEFSLPIPPSLAPSLLPHCHLLDISYSVKVTVRFGVLGGKLTVCVPIELTPAAAAAAPHHGVKAAAGAAAFPKFNKPALQFPYFSKTRADDSLDGSGSERSNFGGAEHATKSRNEHVTTKYKTPLPCGACCLACIGVGIYNF